MIKRYNFLRIGQMFSGCAYYTATTDRVNVGVAASMFRVKAINFIDELPYR